MNIDVGHVVVFTMEHRTLINAQQRNKASVKMKRIEEFAYVFQTDASCKHFTQYEFRDLIEKCFNFLWEIPYSIDKNGNIVYDVKNIEIDLDVITETYTVRFTTTKELTEFDCSIMAYDFDDIYQEYFYKKIEL